MRNKVIKKWCGRSPHIQRHVKWIYFVEKSHVFSQLFLNFKLKLVHLKVINWVLKLKKEFFQLWVICGFFKIVQQPEIIAINQESNFNKMRNLFNGMIKIKIDTFINRWCINWTRKYNLICNFLVWLLFFTNYSSWGYIQWKITLRNFINNFIFSRSWRLSNFLFLLH